jgi:hypothetical protein
MIHLTAQKGSLLARYAELGIKPKPDRSAYDLIYCIRTDNERQKVETPQPPVKRVKKPPQPRIFKYQRWGPADDVRLIQFIAKGHQIVNCRFIGNLMHRDVATITKHLRLLGYGDRIAPAGYFNRYNGGKPCGKPVHKKPLQDVEK